MARIIKQEDYDLHRNTILDTAQRLVYTKGYELISIQDILSELHISKGAFYHYFSSKQELLEGMIERMASQGVAVIAPIVQDDQLGAAEKLLRIFNTASRWKTARKGELLALVKIWYADENATLRLKSQAAIIPRMMPHIAATIRQGNQEGVFHTSYPEQACEIVFSLMLNMGDSLIKHILQPELTPEVLPYLEALTASYQDAIERVLGAQPGSLPLYDPALLREWFTPSSNSQYEGAHA